MPIAKWQNFYVIVGSAAGALTGLQFVVLTLIAQSRAAAGTREIRAFGTPTVIHFCTALLVSALMVAPLPLPAAFGICLGVCGTLGVIYSLGSFWHAWRADYNPDLEDWVWYTTLPLITHLTLLTAGVLLCRNAERSLYLVAADTLLFLLVGIHNAWDTITYIVVQSAGKSAKETDTKSS